MDGSKYCATCLSALPIDVAFCPRCGALRPADPPLPPPRRLALRARRHGRSVLRALRGGRYCVACRSLSPADAAFCILCGADPRPAPAVAPSAGVGWAGWALPGEVFDPLVAAGGEGLGEGLDRLGDGDGECALLGLLVLPLTLAIVWLLGKAARAVVRLAGAARL